jgi:adenylate kinase
MSVSLNDRATWLHGTSCSCSHPPTGTKRSWRVVLLGAPGVGKGTQAELLADKLGACHLSTGDVFRAAKGRAENELGPAMREALGYMKRGELVPDQTVLNVIRERSCCIVCSGGMLLDGFPRTVAQATELQKILGDLHVELDAVLDYRLPMDEIVSRLSGRRTCSKCKAVYHVQTRKPRVDGYCDSCGGALIQREDDRPESVTVRMKAYEQSTRPLTEFYSKLGKLLVVDASGSPTQIMERAIKLLGA